ncbi:MAG TPA: DUF1772 domain-containing protein [Candidatus Acidoferrum sp.]|nr:DUF1772 domain-containing protein [Candidatus Acidoferrum sp.]
MRETIEVLATLKCGIFAGAAIYINLVEQPARLACGAKLAITQWRPSYKRGTRMQASLAVCGSALAPVAWWLSRDILWLIGAAVFFAVVPFTLIAIFPTNKQLEDEALDLSSPHAEAMLRRWGWLHGVRCALSLAAFVIFLFALPRTP